MNTESSPKSNLLQGKRICLIEQDEGNHIALTHLFANAGAQVKDFPQMPPSDAITSEQFDLVVLGDVPREASGSLVEKLLTLCQTLKYPAHRSNHVPLLVISTLNGRAEEDAQKLLAAGADMVFRKPYNTQELVEAASDLTSPLPSIQGGAVLEPRSYFDDKSHQP